MPTLDREPCSVEVPFARHPMEITAPNAWVFRLVHPRNFQPWLTPASLAYVKANESETERLDRQDVMMAMCGQKPIKSFRK